MSESKTPEEVVIVAPMRRTHPALLVASGVFAGIALSWLICNLAKAEKRQAMLGKAP